MRVVLACLALLFAAPVAVAQTTPAAETSSPMVYTDQSPAYRFFPGDEVEVTIFSAPELSRNATIGPDGRLAMPLIGAIRAADLTAEELHDLLVTAYASHLRMPELTVTARSYASRQVFVGGEVARPGIYEMPANMDAFQAIALAGGFLPSAQRGDVLAGFAKGVAQLLVLRHRVRQLPLGFQQPLFEGALALGTLGQLLAQLFDLLREHDGLRLQDRHRLGLIVIAHIWKLHRRAT